VALQKVVTRLAWSVAASASALLLALGLALFFAGRIVGPLRQLSADAWTLAAGNLSHRTAVDTSDEVGVLARTFNTMAAALERRHQDLDDAREGAAAEAAKRTRLEDMERQAKETLAAVIDASPVAIVCSDTERRIVLWNRAAERIFGYSAEETLGHTTKLLAPEAVQYSNQLFDRAIRGETIRDIEVKRRRKDGSLVDVRLAASAMVKPDGTIWGVAWAYDDITDRKKAEAQLEHLAHFDQLTGLPNRRALQNLLSELLNAERNGRPSTLALFDLDGFKDVNDTVGHSIGDRLLVEVARRLAGAADEHGIVHRLGGDEFVVVMAGLGDPRKSAELVDLMLKELAASFAIDGHVLHISGSAGIAIAPGDGASVDELIANADLALYEAKSAGGNTYRFFVPSYRAQAQSRRGLDLELRRAFAENEFELHFQPQLRLVDKVVVGAEALLRWRHPVRGMVSPAAFIDTLSASSIASEVGKWILRESCRTAARWRAMDLAVERIGVNLFPCQFRDPALAEDVEAALRESGLPAEMLELEVTESVALNNDEVIVPLRKLHARGVKLAFDDFGTGYASLSYLTRFPVSRIKIDRNFVAKITDDAEDAAIVRSLIGMGHNLGLAITAEGVETPAQAAFLLRERCEEAQGFLFAKPLTMAEFETYVRTMQPDQPHGAEQSRGGRDARRSAAS
jgi:diguanylate cyclase (GGDEF)-like protein/PAS domain S-box-containing protein